MERAPTYKSHLRSNKLFDQDNVRGCIGLGRWVITTGSSFKAVVSSMPACTCECLVLAVGGQLRMFHQLPKLLIFVASSCTTAEQHLCASRL